MVDIQSAAAEIRRGIKKRKKEERNHRAKKSQPVLFHRADIISFGNKVYQFMQQK